MYRFYFVATSKTISNTIFIVNWFIHLGFIFFVNPNKTLPLGQYFFSIANINYVFVILISKQDINK
ncbi:MAG: hypothetical protein ACJAV8_000144 [Polaribacter sp.]|jgi:hypothetical protein